MVDKKFFYETPLWLSKTFSILNIIKQMVVSKLALQRQLKVHNEISINVILDCKRNRNFEQFFKKVIRKGNVPLISGARHRMASKLLFVLLFLFYVWRQTQWKRSALNVHENPLVINIFIHLWCYPLHGISFVLISWDERCSSPVVLWAAVFVNCKKTKAWFRRTICAQRWHKTTISDLFIGIDLEIFAFFFS